jgi:hypothetical protein
MHLHFIDKFIGHVYMSDPHLPVVKPREPIKNVLVAAAAGYDRNVTNNSIDPVTRCESRL